MKTFPALLYLCLSVFICGQNLRAQVPVQFGPFTVQSVPVTGNVIANCVEAYSYGPNSTLVGVPMYFPLTNGMAVTNLFPGAYNISLPNVPGQMLLVLTNTGPSSTVINATNLYVHGFGVFTLKNLGVVITNGPPYVVGSSNVVVTNYGTAYIVSLTSPLTNAFNGTFTGDGSGLTNIPGLSVNTNLFVNTNETRGVAITNFGNLINGTFAGLGFGLTTLSASSLIGALPSISGAALTGITISQIGGLNTNKFVNTNETRGVALTNFNNLINGLFAGDGSALTNALGSLFLPQTNGTAYDLTVTGPSGLAANLATISGPMAANSVSFGNGAFTGTLTGGAFAGDASGLTNAQAVNTLSNTSAAILYADQQGIASPSARAALVNYLNDLATLGVQQKLGFAIPFEPGFSPTTNTIGGSSFTNINYTVATNGAQLFNGPLRIPVTATNTGTVIVTYTMPIPLSPNNTNGSIVAFANEASANGVLYNGGQQGVKRVIGYAGGAFTTILANDQATPAYGGLTTAYLADGLPNAEERYVDVICVSNNVATIFRTCIQGQLGTGTSTTLSFASIGNWDHIWIGGEASVITGSIASGPRSTNSTAIIESVQYFPGPLTTNILNASFVAGRNFNLLPNTLWVFDDSKSSPNWTNAWDYYMRSNPVASQYVVVNCAGSAQTAGNYDGSSRVAEWDYLMGITTASKQVAADLLGANELQGLTTAAVLWPHTLNIISAIPGNVSVWVGTIPTVSSNYFSGADFTTYNTQRFLYNQLVTTNLPSMVRAAWLDTLRAQWMMNTSNVSPYDFSTDGIHVTGLSGYKNQVEIVGMLFGNCHPLTLSGSYLPNGRDPVITLSNQMAFTNGALAILPGVNVTNLNEAVSLTTPAITLPGTYAYTASNTASGFEIFPIAFPASPTIWGQFGQVTFPGNVTVGTSSSGQLSFPPGVVGAPGLVMNGYAAGLSASNNSALHIVVTGTDNAQFTNGGAAFSGLMTTNIRISGNAFMDATNRVNYEVISNGLTVLGTGTLVADVSALTGTLPALNGAALTSLNAGNLGSGTVPTARLGSGSATSSTYLRGDSTWATVSGGSGTVTSFVADAAGVIASVATATTTPTPTFSTVMQHLNAGNGTDLTSLNSSALTGALPAISGASLTALPASAMLTNGGGLNVFNQLVYANAQTFNGVDIFSTSNLFQQANLGTNIVAGVVLASTTTSGNTTPQATPALEFKSTFTNGTPVKFDLMLLPVNLGGISNAVMNWYSTSNNAAASNLLQSLDYAGNQTNYGSVNISGSGNFTGGGVITLTGGNASSVGGNFTAPNVIGSTAVVSPLFRSSGNANFTIGTASTAVISLLGSTTFGVQPVLWATNGLASLKSNTSALTSISVTASPFTYTAPAGANITVIIGGGVVTALSVNGTTVGTGLTLTGITSIPLQGGDSIIVTYTGGAPTMNYKFF